MPNFRAGSQLYGVESKSMILPCLSCWSWSSPYCNISTLAYDLYFLSCLGKVLVTAVFIQDWDRAD